MNFLTYKNNELYAHNESVEALANKYGTPLYVYSEDYITAQFKEFEQALKNKSHLICYAVKANSNLSVLKLLANLGAGFDLVSIGELERALLAGADPKKIVFSGVAKSKDEITRALNVGIKCFNVESEAELLRIDSIAKSLNVIAPISLRINPDVDANTHPYISTGLRDNKFGISYESAFEIYVKASKQSHLDVVGIDFHIGSQLTELTPFIDAADRILVLVDKLKQNGIHLKHIDFGGGLGVRYKDETPPSSADLANAILQKMVNYPDLEIIFEPGRSLIANAGFLVTKVEYIKHQDDNHFAIVDAGMNDLIRPALYSAWMDIIPAKKSDDKPFYLYDVVGPICESSDFLGKKRELNVTQNDLLIVCSAGAYGFSMASNYNTHPRAAEVMINSKSHRLIRRRESLEQLWKDEII